MEIMPQRNISFTGNSQPEIAVRDQGTPQPSNVISYSVKPVSNEEDINPNINIPDRDLSMFRGI